MQKLLMFAAAIVLGGYGVSQYIARVQPPAPSVAVATTQPAPSGPTPAGRTTVTLPEDGRGHFMAEPQINGARVKTLVDTGASIVALSFEDAARAGVYPAANAFRIPVSTANGSVNAAPVKLREVRIDRIILRDVDAVVLPQGRLSGSLLGMSFLRRLASFEIAKGRLVLTQ